MIDLWPHQEVAINRALDAIARGLPAGLIASPTGSGKTRLFVELARRLGWRVLVLNHTAELIQQTQDAFAEVWPDATVGIVKGPRDEDWAEETPCQRVEGESRNRADDDGAGHHKYEDQRSERTCRFEPTVDASRVQRRRQLQLLFEDQQKSNQPAYPQNLQEDGAASH